MKPKNLVFKAIILILLAFLPSTLKAAPETDQKAVEQYLKFFSGSPASGGSWYVLSVGITQIFEKSIHGLKTSLVPGGSGGGPITVGEGKADGGLVILGAYLDAQEGLTPYTKAYNNLRFLGALYDHWYVFLVLKDSGINKFRDLKGKTVSTGIKGQISEYWFREWLKIYNMSLKDVHVATLGFGDTVSAMKDGKVDSLVAAVPVPMPSLEDLASSREIKWVSFDTEELKKFCSTVNGMRIGVIQRNEIPLKGKFDDVTTALTPVSIMVRADLSEDLVYKMTKALVENIKELELVSPQLKGYNPKNLARKVDPRVKLHPGAEKYYKEKGWLK